MAVIEVRAQEELISAGSLKPKHLLIVEENKNRKYVKVKTVTKVKTGKHGAAKVMVTGKELDTGATSVLTFNGGNSVTVATLTKKQYVVEDIIEVNGEFYMRPNDSSGEGSQPYPYNKMDEEDVNNVIKAFEENNREELIVTLMMAPGYFSIEDIRPNNK